VSQFCIFCKTGFEHLAFFLLNSVYLSPCYQGVKYHVNIIKFIIVHKRNQKTFIQSTSASNNLTKIEFLKQNEQSVSRSLYRWKLAYCVLDRLFKLRSSRFKTSCSLTKSMEASTLSKLCSISCAFTSSPSGTSWVSSNVSSGIWPAPALHGRRRQIDLLPTLSTRSVLSSNVEF
jgi:hypothetical protein